MNISNLTKENIQKQLLKELRTKDIHKIKVCHLTDTLGIHRTTFYLYFDSVYDVLQSIEDDFFEQFHALNKHFLAFPLDNKYYDSPHPLIVDALKFIREKEEITRVLFGPYGDISFQNRCSKLISSYFLAKAVKENYITINNRYMESFLIGGLRNLTVEWATELHPMNPDEMSIMVYRLMFGFYKS